MNQMTTLKMCREDSKTKKERGNNNNKKQPYEHNSIYFHYTCRSIMKPASWGLKHHTCPKNPRASMCNQLFKNEKYFIYILKY